LSSAHSHLHPRISEHGKRMRNSPKYLRRHNLRRSMAESNVGAEKGLDTGLFKRVERRRKRRKRWECERRGVMV